MELLREKGMPMASVQIAKELEMPIGTVYSTTHWLVRLGKIKRYLGLPGVFVLAEEAEG